MELDTSNHSGLALHYYLAIVVKYWLRVIADAMSEWLPEVFTGIAVMEWIHDSGHMHVLFRAQPSAPVSKFMNAYKSGCSRLIKKEFPQIRPKLWKEFF